MYCLGRRLSVAGHLTGEWQVFFRPAGHLLLATQCDGACCCFAVSSCYRYTMGWQFLAVQMLFKLFACGILGSLFQYEWRILKLQSVDHRASLGACPYRLFYL